MDRLLYSPSPTPLKPHLNRLPHLPRLARIDPSKLHFPSSTRSEFAGVHSFSSRNENPILSSSSLPISSNTLLSLNDSRDGSVSKPHFLQQIDNFPSGERKAKITKTFMALCVAILVLIQPVFAPSAFAYSPATTGGPSAATFGGRFFRSELLSSAWTGFFAGCLHTLSGPDHLAALAPLSIGRTRMESAAVGALWGCGHDAGQVIFGLIFLLLKDRLHIEIIRTWGTRVVGITLLVIGALGIREATEVPTPCVALDNGECDVSIYEALENPSEGKKKIGFATFATGIVHGLQPDALMMILPALALPSRVAGAAFLVMFLVGTVVAMGSYTVFIGSCTQALKERVPRITEKLTWAASSIAIALGFAILISQYFGFSLY
ncbi:hypothetical protein IC582_024971 [Cucumis melo]|uniref:Uncharacterized protein LOC103497337 n=2 Tax=Cucumis melo TaxID=3656 RepID=A0A1S3C5P9_CUCME|nr:uncharacterized protein LOC103497337 [Cucumis melo]KAA0045742.1 NicO domain-containing protein [Cucumis melo var. makuwa]TYJ99540.1 NicO domain-containing protein [Cucumis melo var. makuwa]